MSLVVQVWGPDACFTQPGLSAERVSYPVMTPTAAMGVLKAVYWKPEFEYRIERIEVLASIKQFTLRRNAVVLNQARATGFVGFHLGE